MTIKDLDSLDQRIAELSAKEKESQKDDSSPLDGLFSQSDYIGQGLKLGQLALELINLQKAKKVSVRHELTAILSNVVLLVFLRTFENFLERGSKKEAESSQPKHATSSANEPT